MEISSPLAGPWTKNGCSDLNLERGTGLEPATALTEDLKRIDIPTLIIHGDDDQIVLIVASAMKSSKLVKDATLKVYAGAPHGIPETHHDQVSNDLLEFIRS